jgi:glycogen(starch) synthase
MFTPKILMLSWEFPPRIVGGLAPHVYELSRALVKKGLEVHVATCDFPGAKMLEDVDGVKVHRVDSYGYPTPDFATWVSMMNVNLKREVSSIISQNNINLLHAHDWLVASASISLKHMFRIPLVATIHSTEHGRRGGIHNDYQKMISSTEAWLTREAWRIICCSRFMANEISSAFKISDYRLDIVPNGIDPKPFKTPINLLEVRQRFAEPNERLVLYVGRLVQEKGVSNLLEAAPFLSDLNIKFVIVGEGYLKEELIRRVQELGLNKKVYVTGFLDSETIRGLFRTADVCVIPSIYEPFGIVALEAMTAGAPIVTSGSGGLGEILEHDKTATFTYSNPGSIAWGIRKILTNPQYAESLSREARIHAESYEWGAIASSTLGTYTRIMSEYNSGKWKPIKSMSQ